NMSRILCIAVCLLCILPVGSAPAQEDAGTDLILILDASNSMWGQIDGVNKIVIARDSVGELIDSLRPQTNAGLIAYGHRREGDCDDIEVLQEVGPVDKTALKDTINAINPKGRTPITTSINKAIGMARDRSSSAIVLISDGLETCDLDPCAAVRTAKQQGVPFVLHVVGFDIANEDTSQLECAAQEGGGLYLAAEDASQLSEALKSAYEKPVVPDGRLVVSATAEGGLQDAIITVTDAASGEHIAGGRTYVSTATNPRRIPLDDGNYRAQVAAINIQGSPGFSFDFKIVDGSTVEREFDFSAGELSVKVTRNGDLTDAVVSVRVKGERTNAAGGRTYNRPANNPIVKRLAAGTYDVTIKSVDIRNAAEPVFENVVINGGETTALEHEYSSGVLSVGTRRGEALVDSVVSVIDENGKNVGGGRTYAAASSNPRQIIVIPGNYTIRISEVRGERREVPAEVSAGETTEIIIDLDQPQ
ncbi:MAG: VWA domain-containing protein, partial [Gammaproteobacteria bacterium]|nr:VWA domain-containing protein [Gammaproteobacteria bacterium]